MPGEARSSQVEPGRARWSTRSSPVEGQVEPRVPRGRATARRGTNTRSVTPTPPHRVSHATAPVCSQRPPWQKHRASAVLQPPEEPQFGHHRQRPLDVRQSPHRFRPEAAHSLPQFGLSSSHPALPLDPQVVPDHRPAPHVQRGQFTLLRGIPANRPEPGPRRSTPPRRRRDPPTRRLRTPANKRSTGPARETCVLSRWATGYRPNCAPPDVAWMGCRPACVGVSPQTAHRAGIPA